MALQLLRNWPGHRELDDNRLRGCQTSRRYWPPRACHGDAAPPLSSESRRYDDPGRRETFQITPALLVALAERQSNENISLYIDRHGVSGLATAIEYARAYTQSEMNARIMAREQDIPVLEAETILQELQEIILETEPDTATSLDIEELDAAVDERLDE